MTPDILNAAALFASTFVLVFFLGMQSLNVNGGHTVAAIFTSFGIGVGNIIVLKLAPSAGLVEIAAFLCGGPVGIYASMRVHRKFFKKKHIKEQTP